MEGSRTIVRRFEDILERVEEYNPEADLDLLRRAYVYSAREHRDQVRRSGEPYLVHPLEVAFILAELRLDTSSIVAGLLHDVIEDTLTTAENVRQYFGKDVAHIVEGVTKISKLKFATKERAEAENLRKMILAMVDDIRVILVKLADRLHNMRTLGFLPEDKRERIARETFQVYAPIANRLGIGRIKAELEDLSFQYLQPGPHASLQDNLKRRKAVSAKFIAEIQGQLTSAIEEQGIEADITGRVKSTYSIFRKMRAQKIDLDQVYDYLAFRILTGSVKDCYGVLGVVHSMWRPVPGRIKDYIAMPKPNGYRSLHTSIMTDRGHPFEVQIRTYDMHRIAEHGIAAHWQYKEGRFDSDDIGKIAWIRQLMEWQQDLPDPREFVEMVKVDLYPEEVYTFTPKGRVMPFPRGATPVDFAYAIHTEVGHHCVGAKANGRIVPLKYELQNGDIMEIMTQPGRGPSRDWLGFVKTSRARSKIRAWLNASERAGALALGREVTEKELRKYKLPIKLLADQDRIAPALKKLGFAALDDYFAAVGFGKTTAYSFVSALVPPEDLPEARADGAVTRAVKRVLGIGKGGVTVRGMDDVMINLAKCCNPVRGDDIIGYITRGRGVSVHAAQCPNVGRLMFDSDRRIEVEWADAEGQELFDVKLILEVEDRQGLLAKIISTVADQKSNIKSLDARTFPTHDATISLILAVRDRHHVERVVTQIKKIPGVLEVARRRK